MACRDVARDIFKSIEDLRQRHPEHRDISQALQQPPEASRALGCLNGPRGPSARRPLIPRFRTQSLRCGSRPFRANFEPEQLQQGALTEVVPFLFKRGSADLAGSRDASSFGVLRSHYDGGEATEASDRW